MNQEFGSACVARWRALSAQWRVALWPPAPAKCLRAPTGPLGCGRGTPRATAASNVDYPPQNASIKRFGGKFRNNECWNRQRRKTLVQADQAVMHDGAAAAKCCPAAQHWALHIPAASIAAWPRQRISHAGQSLGAKSPPQPELDTCQLNIGRPKAGADHHHNTCCAFPGIRDASPTQATRFHLTSAPGQGLPSHNAPCCPRTNSAPKKQKGPHKAGLLHRCLVAREGFEPPTFGL